jgi:hypothetical protein
LKCFNDGAPPLPAYRAFRLSLVLLYGTTEAARIAEHFDRSEYRDISSRMPDAVWNMLRDNDNAKKEHHDAVGSATTA